MFNSNYTKSNTLIIFHSAQQKISAKTNKKNFNTPLTTL